MLRAPFARPLICSYAASRERARTHALPTYCAFPRNWDSRAQVSPAGTKKLFPVTFKFEAHLAIISQAGPMGPQFR
ncbi:hypothetical protein GN956_G2363 [Arapaima gigas]